MAKSITITQTMVSPDPKKHSVAFKAKDSEKDSNKAFTGVYLMREPFKKLGIKKLEDIRSIEVTVKINAQAKGTDEDDDEDEDEEEENDDE